MTKSLLSFAAIIMVTNAAWAGCNPCVCGLGAGRPPPPECRQLQFDERLMEILNQDSVQEYLITRGGMIEIKKIKTEQGTLYRVKTRRGDVLHTPEY